MGVYDRIISAEASGNVGELKASCAKAFGWANHILIAAEKKWGIGTVEHWALIDAFVYATRPGSEKWGDFEGVDMPMAVEWRKNAVNSFFDWNGLIRKLSDASIHGIEPILIGDDCQFDVKEKCLRAKHVKGDYCED